MLANALAGRARLGQTPFVHHILGRGYRLFDSWHRRSRRPDSQAIYKDRGRAREQQEGKYRTQPICLSFSIASLYVVRTEELNVLVSQSQRRSAEEAL